MLFHGTTQQGIKGILKNGFDSKFYARDGYYGRGAYFTDTPHKANNYTRPIESFDNNRAILMCQVALGRQQHCNLACSGKQGPSKGYHSIIGTAGKYRQYIIDRYGQAKPVFLVLYK